MDHPVPSSDPSGGGGVVARSKETGPVPESGSEPYQLGTAADAVRSAVLDLLDLLAERGDRLRLDDDGHLALVADTVTDRLTGLLDDAAAQVVTVLDDLRSALNNSAVSAVVASAR